MTGSPDCSPIDTSQDASSAQHRRFVTESGPASGHVHRVAGRDRRRRRAIHSAETALQPHHVPRGDVHRAAGRRWVFMEGGGEVGRRPPNGRAVMTMQRRVCQAPPVSRVCSAAMPFNLSHALLLF